MLATTVSRTEHTCNPTADCWFGADTLASAEIVWRSRQFCESESDCRTSKELFSAAYRNRGRQSAERGVWVWNNDLPHGAG